MECPTGILIEFEEEEVVKKPCITRFSVPSTPVAASFQRNDDTHIRGLTYTISDGSNEDVEFLENEVFDFDVSSPVKRDEHLNDEPFSSPASPLLGTCRKLLQIEDDEPKLSVEELTELFNEATHLAAELESQSSEQISYLKKSSTDIETNSLNCENSCIFDVSFDINNECTPRLKNDTYMCKKADSETDCAKEIPEVDRYDTLHVDNCLEGHALVFDNKGPESNPVIEGNAESCAPLVSIDVESVTDFVLKANNESILVNPIKICEDSVNKTALDMSNRSERAKLVDYSCDTPDLSLNAASDIASRPTVEVQGVGCFDGEDNSLPLDTHSANTSHSQEPLTSPFDLNLHCKLVEDGDESAIHSVELQCSNELPHSLSARTSVAESTTPEITKCTPFNNSPHVDCKEKLSLPRICSTPILQLAPGSVPRPVTKANSVTNMRDLRLRNVSSSSLCSEKRNTSVASTMSDDTSPISSGSSSCSINTAKSGLPKPKVSGLPRPGFSSKTSISSSTSSIGSVSSAQKLCKIAETSRSLPLQRKFCPTAAQPIQKIGAPNKKQTNLLVSGKTIPANKNQVCKITPATQGAAKTTVPVRRVQSFRASSSSTVQPLATRTASKDFARPLVQKLARMPPPQFHAPTAANVSQRDRLLSCGSNNSSFGAVTPIRGKTSTPQRTSPASSPAFSFATPIRPSSRLSLAPTPHSEKLSRRKSLAPMTLSGQLGLKSNSSQALENFASPTNTLTVQPQVLSKRKFPTTNCSNKENRLQKN